mmetsp:Transcript_27492/g.69960  ORF Transcript_27492/g.69960 Transcript_27492/m.69960 type:complete len:318 (-) Transcript_27492:521-1474(-)
MMSAASMSGPNLEKWDVLNCFKFCSKCLRVLGHVMVLMVLSIVLASIYAVLATWGPSLIDGSILLIPRIGSAIAVSVFLFLVAMLLWSYFAAVLTDPGRVPPGWHPFNDEQQARLELERMSYSDYYFDRRDPRRPRFCKRCQAWKPERAHHCSVLGRCVLKMDHYCIWVVNCVGLYNYKAFLLFLIYTALACTTACVMLIRPLLDFFSNKLHGPGTPLIFVSVVTNAAFAVSVACFLVMHAQLLAANCTTIEMYEKDRIHPWPYNRGWRRNLEEVFGRHKLRWLLPLHTKEEKRGLADGCLNACLLATPFLSSLSPV